MFNDYPRDLLRRWTIQARECYNRGCICDGCFIYENYFKNTNERCMCKQIVMGLVRVHGKPERGVNYDKISEWELQ